MKPFRKHLYPKNLKQKLEFFFSIVRGELLWKVGSLGQKSKHYFPIRSEIRLLNAEIGLFEFLCRRTILFVSKNIHKNDILPSNGLKEIFWTCFFLSFGTILNAHSFHFIFGASEYLEYKRSKNFFLTLGAKYKMKQRLKKEVFFTIILLSIALISLGSSQPTSKPTISSQTQPSSQATTQKAVDEKKKAMIQPPKEIRSIQPIVVTYSGGLHSYFEPCGCQADMLGGLPRVQNLLDFYRKQGLELFALDAGNLFFEKFKKSPSSDTQNKLKAELIADLLPQLGYKAMGVGPHDLVHGISFFNQLIGTAKIQTISTNLEHLQASWKKHAIHVVKGKKMAILSITGNPPEAKEKEKLPNAYWKARGIRLLDPISSLQAELKILQGKVDFVVLLSTVGVKKLEEILGKVSGIDLAIEGEEGAAVHPPQKMGTSWMVSIEKEGQRLGVFSLFFQKDSKEWEELQTPEQIQKTIRANQKQIKSYHVQAKQMEAQGADFLPIAQVYLAQAKQLVAKNKELEKIIPSLPQLPPNKNGFLSFQVALVSQMGENDKTLKRVKQYSVAVKKANMDALKNIKVVPFDKNGNHYVGVQQCKLCHASQYDFWKTTQHSKAWDTLIKKGKQFDLDCVGCHVVGWQKPGGLYQLNKPEKLAKVQCESCHGYGGLHSKTGDKSKIHRIVPEMTCKNCHQGSHDPKFDYHQKLRFILGKGHGEKKWNELFSKPTSK